MALLAGAKTAALNCSGVHSAVIPLDLVFSAPTANPTPLGASRTPAKFAGHGSEASPRKEKEGSKAGQCAHRNTSAGDMAMNGQPVS